MENLNKNDKTLIEKAAEGNQAIGMKEVQNWAVNLVAAGTVLLVVTSVVLKLTRGS